MVYVYIYWNEVEILFAPTDLKRLYFTAGVENKSTVFLFVDTQVLEESFLEDISNILSSGEVPNLYKPDEFEEVGVLIYWLVSLLIDWLNSMTDWLTH